MYNGSDISFDSEGKLRVEGVDVQTTGHVYLRGKQGVEVLPGVENSLREEEHKISGLKGSISVSRGGVSAGVGYGKSSDKIKEVTKEIIANKLQAAGNVDIKSEEGDIDFGPTNGSIGGKLTYTGKDINILDMQSERVMDRETESSYVGVGVNFGVPAISAAQQIWEAGKGLTKARHKEDYINAGFGAFNAGMGAVSALGGNVLASSVSLNYNKSQNSYHREERMSVGSRLHVKGGVEYNGKNLHTVNLNMLNEGDTVYNITGNIIKEAGKSTIKENSDGKSFGLSVSHDTFDSAGKIQNVLKPSNGTVTAGIGRGKSESQGEYYSHNQDITKGTTYYNNSPDVKIRGVDVQTGGIAGKVASLTVESVQDRTDGKSSGYNISYGIGIGEHAVMRNGTKEMADGLHTTNIGVGYSRGKHTERTTNAIGGFTAEHGVLDVIGKTVQTGSVIGGGFTLNTGTYEKNDLEDVNKRKNVGINLTFTPGVTDVYRNGKLTPDSVGGVLVGTRIDYSKDDYVAKVKATIGNSVNMTVAGKKADLSGVNRDTSNMVDVLKDRKINPVSIDLGTEYWATNYGREKTKGDFAKAGNKIERVVEIIKAVSENEGKDIGLYYRDRLDFEAERDRKERSGE
ncbi:hemagglutinin repeat-containing protein, partial [Pseudoleptotrichia goodfellowii]